MARPCGALRNAVTRPDDPRWSRMGIDLLVIFLLLLIFILL